MAEEEAGGGRGRGSTSWTTSGGAGEGEEEGWKNKVAIVGNHIMALEFSCYLQFLTVGPTPHLEGRVLC